MPGLRFVGVLGPDDDRHDPDQLAQRARRAVHLVAPVTTPPVRSDVTMRWDAPVRTLFGDALATQGGFTLSPDEHARAAGYGFVSGRSTHADRLETIRRTWETALV